jgi:hypothetical protein
MKAFHASDENASLEYWHASHDDAWLLNALTFAKPEDVQLMQHYVLLDDLTFKQYRRVEPSLVMSDLAIWHQSRTGRHARLLGLTPHLTAVLGTFEFLIPRRPVSLQTKSRANLQAWKNSSFKTAP